ncbi:hypothetical protein C5B96_00885, partial [Subtercola sp. Z020]|uniref:proline dehydrogenase family protein n=1 Tax=Subtercola sp. Z020 TaxID=2080582 RepID=UPI000D4B5964
MVDQKFESRAVPTSAGDEPDPIGAEAVALVQQWLAADSPETGAPNPEFSTAQLAFTAALIDGVLRPDDSAVAARTLERLAARTPELVPARLRSALRLGGTVGEALPWAVVPTVRRVLRRTVAPLVADATPSRLGETLARLSADGSRVTLDVVGELARGVAGAARYRAEVGALLARPGVHGVSVRLSSLVAAADLSLWEFDETVGRVAEALVPLGRQALSLSRGGGAFAEGSAAGPAGVSTGASTAASTGEVAAAVAAASGVRGPLITLDADQHRHLDLAVAVFRNVLSRSEFAQLEAGITLQADLPDSLAALRDLQGWASARVAAGGAPITVRLVRSGDRAAERVESAVRGWPLAIDTDPVDVDRALARLLDAALTPERTAAVRIVLAADDLFDTALAVLLAERRGCAGRLALELPPGMRPTVASRVRESVGAARAGGAGDAVWRRMPVVHPREFAAVSPYLVRLGDQKADTDVEGRDARFLASLAGLSLADPGREAFAVMDSILDSDEAVEDARPPRSPRTQDRTLATELVPPEPGPFTNTTDTDLSLPSNREWARRIVDRAAASRLGVDTLSAARHRDALLAAGAAVAGSSDAGDGDAGDVDAGAVDAGAADARAGLRALIHSTAEAGTRWGAQSAAERAAHLRRAALSLEANRDRLVEVMLSEAAAPFDAADAQASAAVDSALFSAGLALDLERIDGARHQPPALVVVVPSADAPVASPAGAVLRALAAGAAVLLRPAPGAGRASAVLAEALWESGIPRDALVLVDLAAAATDGDADADEAVGGGGLLRTLIADPHIEHVLLEGDRETAALFRSWRSDLSLLAETGSGYSVVVTPSADLALAASNIAATELAAAGPRAAATPADDTATPPTAATPASPST